MRACVPHVCMCMRACMCIPHQTKHPRQVVGSVCWPVVDFVHTHPFRALCIHPSVLPCACMPNSCSPPHSSLNTVGLPSLLCLLLPVFPPCPSPLSLPVPPSAQGHGRARAAPHSLRRKVPATRPPAHPHAHSQPSPHSPGTLSAPSARLRPFLRRLQLGFSPRGNPTVMLLCLSLPSVVPPAVCPS